MKSATIKCGWCGARMSVPNDGFANEEFKKAGWLVKTIGAFCPDCQEKMSPIRTERVEVA